MSKLVDRQAIQQDAEATILANPHRAAVARAHDCLALLAELERAQAELRLREESQIPVIPHGAQAKIDRLEAQLAQAEADRDQARKLAGHWSNRLDQAERERDEALRSASQWRSRLANAKNSLDKLPALIDHITDGRFTYETAKRHFDEMRAYAEAE